MEQTAHEPVFAGDEVDGINERLRLFALLERIDRAKKAGALVLVRTLEDEYLLDYQPQVVKEIRDSLGGEGEIRPSQEELS